ncbi:MAG: hypothetical protein ABMA00_12630 [Gemmatimonas sp.]
MKIREATPDDGAQLIAFFQRTPMSAGTAFVFDRGPDFFALLALRGSSRTFLLFDGDHLAGTATALWHATGSPGQEIVVGEVVDLRVADFARGTRAAWQLLGAVREAFSAAGVMWVSCLIGGENHVATALVHGRAGLPSLTMRRRYASVHYVACRPLRRTSRHWVVAQASPADTHVLGQLLSSTPSAWRGGAVEASAALDLTTRSTAWIARDSVGRPLGALRLWDGESVRRIRVLRYQPRDLPLRLFSRAAGMIGRGVALPPRGGVLRTWASRGFALVASNPDLVRALVCSTLHAAVDSGRHVVQINLDGNDPLLDMLPRFPRSTFWSTVFGAPFGSWSPDNHLSLTNSHADIALA